MAWVSVAPSCIERCWSVLLRRAFPMEWGVSVDHVTRYCAQLGSQQIRYHWLVCADGQNSRLRKAIGLDSVHLLRRRYGFRQHFRVVPWSKYVEVHWANCGQLYITPTAEDEICVALITSNPTMRLRQALREFPQIEERLRGCAPVTREQGAITSDGESGIGAQRPGRAVGRSFRVGGRDHWRRTLDCVSSGKRVRKRDQER